jgi:hypothetical protein
MKFVNANFIRGDKQRCLMMRSIVKKAMLPVQQQPQAPSQHQQQVLRGGGMLPPFVQNTMGQFGLGMPDMGMPGMGMPVMGLGQFGMGMGGGGTSVPPHRPLYSQDARQLPFLPSANQAGGEHQISIMNSLLGAPPSLQFGVHNQFSQGATRMGMMSADMFEGHRERMEQLNQQQRQMQQMTGFHNLNVSNAQPINDQPHAAASSAFNPQQSVPPAMRYYVGNTSYGNNTNVGGHTDAPNNDGNASDTSPSLVVDIATQLMMNDPNLLPRQALEMAMQIHNQNKQS